jgi:hypothetical protein
VITTARTTVNAPNLRNPKRAELRWLKTVSSALQRRAKTPERSTARQKRMIAARPPDLCNCVSGCAIGPRWRDIRRASRRNGRFRLRGLGRDIARAAAGGGPNRPTAMDAHLSWVNNQRLRQRAGDVAKPTSRRRAQHREPVRTGLSPLITSRWLGRTGLSRPEEPVTYCAGRVYEPSPGVEVAGLCAPCSRQVCERSSRGG